MNLLLRPIARLALTATATIGLLVSSLSAAPIKIGYSDWPGWMPWEIALKKGWFEDAGVEVDFQFMDYVESMDAYAAGALDAVSMTNGDALVTGATGKPSIAVICNDYSNGNDMLIGRAGLNSVKDLKGKKVGVEVGFVSHLLLLTALESVGMSEDDVEVVNVPNGEAPQVLASGGVDAVCAWQPSSGQALKLVDGSKTLFTSADAPGIIYDLLYASPESLESRRDDWKKIVGVWYKTVDFLKDEDNLDEVLDIMAAKVSVSPDEYEPFLEGTYVLTLEEAAKIWQVGEGLGSLYGSSKIVDDFNLKFGVYDSPEPIEKYLDPSLTLELLKSSK
jgi:NitT/TauT family transport system substrate-binding protein